MGAGRRQPTVAGETRHYVKASMSVDPSGYEGKSSYTALPTEMAEILNCNPHKNSENITM